MARRKALTTDEQTTPLILTQEAPATEADAPVRRRRRRRTSVNAQPDYAQETVLLVDAVLRSRGVKGATQEIMEGVVNWARGVRSEGEELRQLAARPRRQKTQAPTDRVSRYEVNRALLEGVLAGTITLEIPEQGSLQFIHASYVSGPIYSDVDSPGLPTLPDMSGVNEPD